jgi:prepilin-type N-terminal cleavage/methylation domain-containing protein
MKTASPQRSSAQKGMTLLELTVVIGVLLALTSILFLGARAWKNGADRTACLLNIRNVQVSVRSYQNLYGYNPGGMPYAEGGSQDIAAHLFAKGYITERQLSAIQGGESCTGGGAYEREHPDTFPPVGQLYITCSLSSTKQHAMAPDVEW